MSAEDQQQVSKNISRRRSAALQLRHYVKTLQCPIG